MAYFCRQWSLTRKEEMGTNMCHMLKQTIKPVHELPLHIGCILTFRHPKLGKNIYDFFNLIKFCNM